MAGERSNQEQQPPMSNILTAANEYARRPTDQRFTSLEAIMAAAQHQKDSSAERTYNAKDLRVVPVGDAIERNAGPDDNRGGTLMLESPKARAHFTHWSFGQLCRSVEAPASYLRTLPPAIAADALNYGLRETAAGTDLKLLVQAPNGKPEATVRACTSDSYGRVWDADIYQQLTREITNLDTKWMLPPTWEKDAAGNTVHGGAYRGDRDSFLMLVNGGSIVEDPTLRTGSAQPMGTGSQGDATRASQDGAMYRGIMVRNSEVGAASIVIETVLYRYICGNHILWGAALDTTFRRRHVGNNACRDAVRELARIAYNYTESSAAKDEAIIRTLATKEIAATKEGLIDELRKLGATKDVATRAYELAEQTEAVSPRSYWGAIQGLTRTSQEAGYQDLRFETDLLAAQLLKKGARVAA